MSGPPVDRPKDPWPHVLSLSERFVGNPASLSRDNIFGTTVEILYNNPRLILGGAVKSLQTAPIEKFGSKNLQLVQI